MNLRSRLLVSYFLIIAVFMCIISLVLVVLAQEVLRGIVFQRLNTVADASLALVLRPQLLAELPLERLTESRQVRVLLTDADGNVSRDSDGQGLDWNLLSTADYEKGDRGLQGSWRDAQNQTWLFVGRHLDLQGLLARRLGWIVFAQPQPNRRQWFAENLLRPLVLAGLIGLALSALLAWLISRSVARPLQQVAEAAHAIARGDYAQTVPVSGPAEVRDLADDFNAMAQQVRVSRDAQRDFVANVSHELKTPLTSIQGYSQAILDGTAADAVTVGRSAGIIHDEAERMGRMVSELLDLARIESGQITMRQAPVSLSTLLETLIERFRLRAEEAQIALTAQLAELPSVIGDGDRLTQVFANLLDNALKHTPQGGKVTITARTVTPTAGAQKRKPAPPMAVEVAVSDSGAGIPPEDLARVFERFYQVDKSRKHTGSVGLGLAIAREIVEAHDGSVKAESVVGLGTRITVLLPVRTT